HQEKPVTPPGYIACDRADSRHLYRDVLAIAPGSHIAHRYTAILMQGAMDIAYRCFDRVLPGLNASQVGERCDQTDGAMSAHTQIPAVIEKNDSGSRLRIYRFTQQCPDQYVV